MSTGTQTQLQAREKKYKKRHVQMFIDPPLYERMKTRAALEGLPTSVWIRRVCALALRRESV